MASGLFALLDDIAIFARKAAVTVDDLASVAMRASAKSAGVIIDDAAVTPQYVHGFKPERELHVIKRIGMGSLKNKFFYILPAAMILSTWAPWVLPVLLIIGGSYLAFEGAEKVLGWFGVHLHHEKKSAEPDPDSPEYEDALVAGAVRTDLILSAEIMLITLSNVDTPAFLDRIIVLSIVAVLMTLLVYGAVSILVKMDDIGLVMSRQRSVIISRSGLGIVKAMPHVLTVIGVVGAVAMLWVGGHILLKSLYDLGLGAPYTFITDLAHGVEAAGPVVVWLADTAMSAVVGLTVGLIIVAVVAQIGRWRSSSEVQSVPAKDVVEHIHTPDPPTSAGGVESGPGEPDARER